METRTQEDRASSLLQSIKPELTKLLSAAPTWGAVSLELVFHDDTIVRLVSKIEVSRKPSIGGQHG